MKLSKKAVQIKTSETLSISAEAKRLIGEGVDVVDFGAGEPDFDTPAHIKKAAVSAINDNFTRYTNGSGVKELREAICKKLKKENNIEYNYNQIVVSNGSKQAILNACIALLNHKDEVLIPSPYWVSYPEIVRIAGGVPVFIETHMKNCFKVTREQLENALTKKTKALILNSPSNPTGMVYSLDELKMIADFAIKNDIFVISDEIYEKLIYSRQLKHISIASLNSDIYNRTIVVNGLSKSHAMTGWRVGYTAANIDVSKAIEGIQSHSTSNINSVAQMAALAALTGEQKCVDDMVREFKIRRDYISQRISDIPLLSTLIPKGAFYLFVDISKLCGNKIFEQYIENAKNVSDILLDKYKVAVVPCDNFGADKYIRISYAVSMENIVKGINRIEKFVKENF